MQSSRKKKINYAEVASDVDWDEEERELDKIKASEQLNSKENKSKKVGDTFGTTSRGKSKKRRRTTARELDRESTAAEELDEPTYDSKLLLDLPFDLLVEVCSHVEGEDLLSLAKVNTVLRNILLSRGARSIWSSLRRKLGFPLPDGLSELDFALLEYSEACQTCEKDVRDQICNTFLRTRQCQQCLKAYTISSKGLFKAWPSLHRSAVQCVRYHDLGSNWRGKQLPHKYLISDLETVDQVLKELEDDDENAISRLQSVRVKGSSTRPRRSSANEEAIEANQVENFVREKQEWVKNEQNTSEQIVVNRFIDSRLIPAFLALRIVESLKSDHQWADDEAEYLKRWGVFDRTAPKGTVEEDPAAWTECRSLIRKILDDRIAEKLKGDALNARRSLLRPYYDELELEKHQWDLFPTYYAFMELNLIKPLWEPEDAVINDEIWTGLRPEVLEEITALEESTRVDAIRSILAANQGISLSSLTNDPADYPKSTYTEEFFSRVTSLFLTFYDRTRPLASYSQILQGRPGDLSYRINSRSILIIRSLFKAIGKDPDRCSVAALNSLAAGFVWTNDPRKSRRGQHRNWRGVFIDAIRKGPSAKKIAQGARFEFKYRNPYDPEPSDDDDDDSQDKDEGDDRSDDSEGDEQEMNDDNGGGSQTGSHVEEDESEQDDDSDEE
ncbi:uncharacterized protein JCM6883_007462 [Sporobolomyces salmoneus]|uniref:uncharacterized protein n=1 Tax=Sporobolomyces salmoneus TaxID=183962 RepID=UPI00316C81E3